MTAPKFLYTVVQQSRVGLLCGRKLFRLRPLFNSLLFHFCSHVLGIRQAFYLSLSGGLPYEMPNVRGNISVLELDQMKFSVLLVGPSDKRAGD